MLADIRAQHERLVERGSTLELAQTIDFATIVVVLRLAAPDSYRLLVQSPTDGMGAWRALKQKLGYHFGLQTHRNQEVRIPACVLLPTSSR